MLIISKIENLLNRFSSAHIEKVKQLIYLNSYKIYLKDFYPREKSYNKKISVGVNPENFLYLYDILDKTSQYLIRFFLVGSLKKKN